MKVILLAGGYGTHIGEETQLKPKPMIEIEVVQSVLYRARCCHMSQNAGGEGQTELAYIFPRALGCCYSHWKTVPDAAGFPMKKLLICAKYGEAIHYAGKPDGCLLP